MKRTLLLLLVIGGTLILLLLFPSDPTGAHLALQVAVTPTAFNYLPVIARNSAFLPSPTLTPTLTPTPTSIPCQVSGPYLNSSYYITPSGNLHIFGEVFSANCYITRIKITAKIHLRFGYIGTASAHTYLDTLSPNTATCFHIFYVVGDPSDFSGYTFEPVEYVRTGAPWLPWWVTRDVNGTYNPTFGRYEIQGKARNPYGYRLENVKAVITLLRGQGGSVLGCDYTYTMPSNLNPGNVGSFQKTFYDRDYADVGAYQVQVEGNLAQGATTWAEMER